MWFKNLHIFRFLKPFTLSAEQLHEALASATFHPCLQMEMESIGWVPPLGNNTESLVHSSNQCIIFTLRKEVKILPSSVVKDFVNDKVEEIENQQMRKVGKREKDQIREEVLQDLIPRAFTNSHYLSAYVDVKNGWLVVDTASRKKAEELTQFLRGTLGSLPIVSPQVHHSPTQVMTRWLLKDNELPHDFELADACVLVDNSQEGAVVNCKRQDLQAEEIHAHLDAGKSVSRLALEWNERLALVLDDELVIRRLQFLALTQDQADEGSVVNEKQRFDADFALMTLELANLIKRLLEIFGGENETAYAQKR
jgi:recombination associated protein RdgC